MGVPAVALDGAATEKCVAVPAEVPLTALKVALICTTPLPELTVSGLVCEMALPFMVEDWNSYSVPPMFCGSVKVTVHADPALRVRLAGVV